MFGKGVGLIVSIAGDSKELSKALNVAGVDIKGFGTDTLATAAKVSVVAGAAVAAGAAIFGMAKAAADDRAEQQKLEAAIASAGAATAISTQQVNDAIAAGQDKAFTDTQTRDALQSLVLATGDVTSATSLLAQAQDIARFAGVDLATASDAVAKAAAGQDTQLARLLPGLEKGATATDTLANASKAAAGQADLYAKSAEGMQARAGDSFSELSETIGEVFLPVLPIIIQLIKLFGQLISAVLPILVPILKVVASVLTVVGNVLSVVVGWIIKLVNWITEAIGKIGDFVAKLNPLSGIKLPSLPFLNSTGTPAGVSALQTSAGGSSVAGGVQINIYGDPSVIEAKVTKALRDYARRNGSAAVLGISG
jgi:hypothetical protein